MTEKSDTFSIPEERLLYLEKGISDLATKAKKLGLDFKGIGMEVVCSFSKKVRRVGVSGSYTVLRHFVEVRVTGEAPVLNGWKLLGHLDFASAPGAILRSMVPGEACPEEFYEVESTRCDSCRIKRKRNDVFLVEHEDGRRAAVGRQCLRDYLGHLSPSQIALMAATLDTFRQVSDPASDFWCAMPPDIWSISETLLTAAYSIREYGWNPSQSDSPTKEHVLSMLTPHKDRRLEEQRLAEWRKVTEADSAKAEASALWVLGIDVSNDYTHNLHATINSKSVTSKSMGLAVSAVYAYNRHLEKEQAKLAESRLAASSEWVGSVKERREFTLTLNSRRTWENTWGTVFLHSFSDEEGNVIVWKASKNTDLEVGDYAVVKGTVKEHSMYRETKQTVLTRCSVLSKESR